MKLPCEIKMELDAKLLALAQGGAVPEIIGLHSVVVEGDTVSVGYDLDEPDGETLFFEFERPAQVGRDDVREFGMWLAWSDIDRVVH